MSDDDVTAPWWPDDIRLVTDTDLEAKRYACGQLSDPIAYSARLAETVRRSEGLETVSAAIDRGLRVELAILIDNTEVMFTREEYDIAYTIPPASWVSRQQFPTVALVDDEQLAEADVDPEERGISYTTAEVVYEMLGEAVNESEYDGYSDVCRGGLERLISGV